MTLSLVGNAAERVADSAAVFSGMKQRGVLVKNVAPMHPLLASCLRLTVGTKEENAQMLDALRASLSTEPSAP